MGVWWADHTRANADLACFSSIADHMVRYYFLLHTIWFVPTNSTSSHLKLNAMIGHHTNFSLFFPLGVFLFFREALQIWPNPSTIRSIALPIPLAFFFMIIHPHSCCSWAAVIAYVVAKKCAWFERNQWCYRREQFHRMYRCHCTSFKKYRSCAKDRSSRSKVINNVGRGDGVAV